MHARERETEHERMRVTCAHVFVGILASQHILYMFASIVVGKVMYVHAYTDVYLV